MSRSKIPMAMAHHGTRPSGTAPYPVRHAVAFVLRAAGAALDRLAERVAVPAAAPAPAAHSAFEFYAQAGAPEGALYVDGQFVGWIQGVQRL